MSILISRGLLKPTIFDNYLNNSFNLLKIIKTISPVTFHYHLLFIK